MAILALMLLFSPMSSKAHFCVLLVPQLALVRIAWAHRDRFLLTLTVLVGIGGFCTGKDISGRRVYELLLWNGLVFWLTVALLAGCCYARWRYGRAAAVTAAEPAPAPREVRPIRIGDEFARMGSALRGAPKPITDPAALTPDVVAKLAGALSRPAAGPDAFEPARAALTELPDAARAGLEPVAGTAQKAFSRLVRDVGGVGAKKQPN